MRILLLAIGACLAVISIPGYLDSPSIISQMIHSFTSTMTGSIPGTNGGSMLKQMGYPSRTVVIPMIQYMFAGLGVAGVGIAIFGIVAKKIPKQVKVKLVTEEPEKVKEIHMDSPSIDENAKTNLRSLRILQERLAKGEITSSEFQNLKRFLE